MNLDEYSIVVISIVCNAIIKGVCFLLGYKTVKLGYQLMVDGVKGEFNFTSDFKGIKAGLISSSPGLLFLLLGIFLIGYAMGVTKTVSLDSYVPANANKRERILIHDTDGVKDSL
jgi:hypothetical protein